MSKQITVVDSSVLINAAIGPDAARRMRALAIVGDPNREFAATRYLQLEVLPIPTRYQKHRERRFYDQFFNKVTSWLDESSLIQPALDLACRFGLGAMDALHLAAAISVNAEFISAEKPTKPIYQAWQNISTIY